jgi:hypothetical protein
MVAVRRRAGNEFDQHVNNVTVRRGFYNARSADGRLHDAVENWFMTDIESPAGAVLNALRETREAGPVADGEIEAVSNFVAAQLHRTATVRSYLGQIDDYIGPLIAVDKVAGDLGIDHWRLTPQQRARHRRAAATMLRRHRVPHEVRASELRTTLREIDRTMTRLRSWHWESRMHPRPASSAAMRRPSGCGPIRARSRGSSRAGRRCTCPSPRPGYS